MGWLPLVIGAGLGALKNLEANQMASKNRQTQSAIARYSPWTGMQPQNVQDPSIIGDVLQGGTAGAMFGQGMAGAAPQADPGSMTSPLAMSGSQPMNSWMQLVGKYGGKS